MKKALKILVLVFVISVLAMTVVACDVDCPNGHTWNGGTVTKQPTCTEAGERTYTCAVCGTTRTAAVEALGHSYNYVPEVPADCTTAGTAAHYTCSRCDKLFISQNGEMKEVTASELVVTANHSYNSGIVTKYPTCTEAGEKTYTCLSCGETKTEVIAATGHDYGEEIAEVPATCTTSGTKAHYECANCHQLFVDAEGEKTQVTVAEITLAPAHSFDDGVVTTQPTCQATGIKTYTCSACHATHTELVPATGHDYGDEITEVPSTCTTQGTAAHYQCASCGKLFVDDNGVKKEVAANELVIALAPHAYDEGTVTTQPTCEKDGVKIFACTACGHTYTEKVAATGHNYGEEIAEAAATCTATGTKAHYECANCHKLFVDVNGRKIQVTENYLTIALVPHTVVVDEAVEPTCTATGLTQGSHCSVCDAVIVAQTEIPANGHSYGELIAEVAATCEAAGTKAHYECAACGKYFVEVEGEKTQVTAEDLAIPATGHTYNAAETHSNKCVNCDNEISFEEIVAIIKGLDNKEETTDTYLLKGEVTGFDGYRHPYIKVEGTSDTVLCYYLHEGTHDGVAYDPADLKIGYTITVVGPLKKYNSTLEIEDGYLIGAISPQRTVTLEPVTNGTVNVVGGGEFPTTAHDGDEISFTVTANEGYKVASVTVNGTAIIADADGTYTATVNGNTTIKVEIVEDSVVVIPEKSVTITYEGSTTNMTGNNDAASIFGLDDSIFNIYSIKNSGSAHVGLNKDGTIRLYKNGATTLVISVAEGYTITRIVIEPTLSSLQVTVNEATVTGSNGQYDINANKLSIDNMGESTAEIDKITVYYTEPVLCDHVIESYTPNNDGTHSGECTICGETVTEDCTYQGGSCTVCGAAQPSHSIAVEIANGRVTDLNGESLSATALHGTELSFKVAVDEGYVVDKVTVNGEPVDAVDGVYTVIIKGDTSIVVSTRDAATTVTVTWETFTSTSDAKDDISYTTAKGEGTSNPVINNGVIRLYQNSAGTGGGEITVTADNGKTITAISIGSGMRTSVKYSYVNADGVTVEETVSLSANGQIDLSDVNATSITFTCMGTSSSTRFYVNYLSVTYR